MSFYIKTSMRLFSQFSDSIVYPYFVDIKSDLKRAGMKISVQEYVSIAIMTCFIIFLFEVPILSFIFGFIFRNFLFGLITSFTVSIFITIFFFFLFMNYPKVVIKEKAKKLDNALPFASLYLSTISGAKLPIFKTFKIFSRYSRYGEIAEETNKIANDMELFGIDVNTALEKAIERTPSKNFKEMLYGILSTTRAGGDIATYLNEKAKGFINDYRRKVYEFSHQLTIFVEVYLTAIVIGAIFFTILTAIISGISGAPGDIILLQFFLIFILLPVISGAFIILIKSMTPGGE